MGRDSRCSTTMLTAEVAEKRRGFIKEEEEEEEKEEEEKKTWEWIPMGWDREGILGPAIQQSSNQRRNSMKPITAILVTAFAVVPCAPGCGNPASTDRLSHAQAFESPDAVIHIRGVS